MNIEINKMSLRKRRRKIIVYESLKVLMFYGELEISELIQKVQLNVRYKLTHAKLAQCLKDHPDIERDQEMRSSKRIAIYKWKPSN